MLPRVGSRKCVSRLKHVVFPAPFGPMRAWMLPRLTLRLTSLTATKPLNSLVSWRVSRMQWSVMRWLFPAPARLALAEKGVDALARVGEHHVARHALGSEGVRILQAFLDLFVEELLAHRHHRAAVGEDLLRERVDFGVEADERRHAIDQAPGHRGPRVDEIAGE